MAHKAKGAAPTEEELANMTVEELNEYADREFDWDSPEEIQPATPRQLDTTITVRFNREELEGIRRQAETAGKKVTAYIREVTLEHAAAELEAGPETLQAAADVEAAAGALRRAVATYNASVRESLPSYSEALGRSFDMLAQLSLPNLSILSACKNSAAFKAWSRGASVQPVLALVNPHGSPAVVWETEVETSGEPQ